MFTNNTQKTEEKPEVVEAVVKTVETKKVVKSSLKKEEEAIEKQMKELEAKLKADKEKLRLKRKDLDLKIDRKLSEIVRKWHTSGKDISSLKEEIYEILGDR